MIIFDWRVGATAFAFILLHILISNRRNHAFFPKIDEVRKKNQAQSKLQSELFRNATLVIAEGQEDKTVVDFNQSAGKATDFTIKIWLKYIKSYYSQKFTLTIGRYLTLALGIYFILMGYHSVGMFVTFYSWTGSIFDNINQIMNAQRQIMFQIVEIRKYFDLLDIVPDIDPNIGGKTVANLEGKIVGKGTHAELEKKNKEYQKLIKNQILMA